MKDLPLPPQIVTTDTTLPWAFAKHEQTGESIAADHYLSECIILACGFGEQAELAAQEVVETTLLAYKILRTKQFYFSAHGQLMPKLVHIAGRKLFKLRSSFPDIKASLTVVCLSVKRWWIVSTDTTHIYLYRGQQLVRILPQEELTQIEPQFLGETKYPQAVFTEGDIQSQDQFLLTTKPLAETVNTKRLTEFLKSTSVTSEKWGQIPQEIVNEAVKRRKQSSYGAVLAEHK
ncbi:hypothetical protein A2699_06010 [Candidatus Gottesmanbacteria bacterium RIFCSPHIGHO2_01_FULL_43_15]|nr:MAG: hypothetical protein A2699_06010 [Candidatus Gottesmanbacteria bacterium RIFCSPHIGHO2_01_FULL_43_15]